MDRIHPAQVEEVVDHPHERAQRRRIGVDQRDAPQVEVHRARDVAGGEILRRSQVEDQRAAVAAELLGEGTGRCQELGV